MKCTFTFKARKKTQNQKERKKNKQKSMKQETAEALTRSVCQNLTKSFDKKQAGSLKILCRQIDQDKRDKIQIIFSLEHNQNTEKHFGF